VHIVHGRAEGHPSKRRSKTFTGQVWADPVMRQTPDGNTISSVTYTPGARTYWHHHTGGQIIVVTAGLGWICSEGSAPESIRAGDTVWIPANERHWHGGTTTTVSTQLGISIGPTIWQEEVAEEDYLKALATVESPKA
jgi:quercetin dioxygenase-like cupin family protein